MATSDPVWWAATLFLSFCVFFIVAMILRNRAAKSDSLVKCKNDAIRNSVSIKPKENTRKLD